MLYNPKWDRNSLIGLRDWLAQQPADKPYNWSSCKTCVVGMYLEDMGETHMRYAMWCSETPGAVIAVPKCFGSGWNVDGSRRHAPMTLGEALENLDNWLAKNAIPVAV